MYPVGPLDRDQQKAFSNEIKAAGGGGVDVVYDAVGGDYAEPAVRAYMDTHNLLPRSLDIAADDIREGLIAIVNLFMVDPQFQHELTHRQPVDCAHFSVELVARAPAGIK